MASAQRPHQTDAFFNQLIKTLMANQRVSPKQLDRALSYLSQSGPRRSFIHELSNERGNYESQALKDVQFLILSLLFKASFDAMLVDGKCPDKRAFDKDTLLLMNMSMTYFRLIGSGRQYIAETLKNHPAFAEFSFWQLAYKVESRQKYMEQIHICYGAPAVVQPSSPGPLSEPTQSHALQQQPVIDDEDQKQMWRMIRISTLHFFGLAFHEFGRPREDLEQFVQFMNRAYQLQLSESERGDIFNSYAVKAAQPTYKEAPQDKYARLQLEKAIEHDFEVARAIHLARPAITDLIDCELALISLDQQDTGLELNLTEEAVPVEPGFEVAGVKVPQGYQIVFV